MQIKKFIQLGVYCIVKAYAYTDKLSRDREFIKNDPANTHWKELS